MRIYLFWKVQEACPMTLKKEDKQSVSQHKQIFLFWNMLHPKVVVMEKTVNR